MEVSTIVLLISMMLISNAILNKYVYVYSTVML